MKREFFSKQPTIVDDLEKICGSISDFQTLEAKKILITGANGMIPSYLVYFFCYINQFILKKPCELYLVVRKKNNSRINNLLNLDYVNLIIQDIGIKLQIPGKMNYIIHAASSASPNVYIHNPLDTLNANVLGLYNLLKLDLTRLESFIFFSTAELYGNPSFNNIPTKESYIGTTNFHDIRACYVEAKRFGEVLCMNYFRQHGVPVKIIRPFHVFSPEIDHTDSRVFSSFITTALEEKKIEIVGDGKSSRSLCYITDAITLILKILMSDYNGEIFNIGNEKNEITIKKLALLIAKIVDNNVAVRILNNKQEDFTKSAPIRSCPNMNKAKKLLQFQSKITLREGFTKVIEYQKKLALSRLS